MTTTPPKDAASVLREALQSLYEMTSRYAISDTDYGIVCNAAAALDTERAAIQPTGDAECRTTCNICADENGNAWPCAKSKARGAIPQEAKAELVGDAVWNALSLMLDVFHKPIGMFSNEARACEIARKALSAPASKSEASELPGLPDDAAAWVTPLRYGSKVTFPKPPKPDQWDDEEGEWYCNPLFNADQTTAYGQLCRDTAPNAWRQAIYDACAVAFIDCGPESDPRKAIEALIQVHIDAARQPVAAPFEQAARPAAESASNQTLTGDETENDQRQAATLNKLADQVVLANATGNEQLYLLAVTGLLAAVRALKSAAPVAPAQAVTRIPMLGILAGADLVLDGTGRDWILCRDNAHVRYLNEFERDFVFSAIAAKRAGSAEA